MVKNLIGKKYGKLTVIEHHGFTQPNKFGQRHSVWYCKCDCGNYIERTTDVLKREKSSCGCIQKEILESMSKKNIDPMYLIFTVIVIYLICTMFFYLFHPELCGTYDRSNCMKQN